MTSLLATDNTTNVETAQAITTLQIELQNSIALANDYKQDNTELKRQLDSANAFSSANLQRHAMWKEVWRQEKDALAKREKQLEQDEKALNCRLEEGRRELKEMKLSVLNTSNGGGLDVNDIQSEHASKVEKLTEECNQWREQFYNTRKSYEEVEAKHESSLAQVKREQEIAISIQAELSALQQSFAEYIEKGNVKTNTSSPSESVVAELKIQLEEKELLLQKLHEEVESIRQDRDSLVCAKDDMLVAHQMEHSNTLQECTKYKAKVSTLEQQIQASKSEVLQLTSVKDELEESLSKSNAQVMHLQESLITKEKEHKQSTAQWKEQLATCEKDLKKEITCLKQQLSQEQAKVKDLERQCIQTQEHALQQISKLAEDLKPDKGCKEELLIAKDQILRLDNTISSLQHGMKQQLLNKETELQRLEHTIETCHQDLNLCLIEKTNAENTTVALQTKATNFKKQLEETESSLAAAENKNQLLLDEKLNLSQKVEVLSDENKCSREKASSVEGALKNEVGKVTQLLDNEKRRSNAYKAKAVEAHEKNVKAKELLNNIASPQNK